MDSYIIRIYQRENTHLVGVVETMEKDEWHPIVFHDAGELWCILTGGHPEIRKTNKEDPSPTSSD